MAVFGKEGEQFRLNAWEACPFSTQQPDVPFEGAPPDVSCPAHTSASIIVAALLFPARSGSLDPPFAVPTVLVASSEPLKGYRQPRQA
jgi:hypothetical protein